MLKIKIADVSIKLQLIGLILIVYVLYFRSFAALETQLRQPVSCFKMSSTYRLPSVIIASLYVFLHLSVKLYAS